MTTPQSGPYGSSEYVPDESTGRDESRYPGDPRYTDETLYTEITDAGRPDISEESVGSLVSRLSNDVTRLMRQELALAKAELREEAKTAGKAAGMLGGAGLAAWMTLLFASFTLIWVLDNGMDLAWAALIVTGFWAIVGAVLFLVGRKKMRQVNPKPEQTVETLKEDKEWLKAQKN